MADYLLRLSASNRLCSLIHTSSRAATRRPQYSLFPLLLNILQRFVSPNRASRSICCSLLQRCSIGRAFFLTEFAALSISMQPLTTSFFRTFFPDKACKAGPMAENLLSSLLARAFPLHPSQLCSFSCSASSPSNRAPACPAWRRCGLPKPALP